MILSARIAASGTRRERVTVFDPWQSNVLAHILRLPAVVAFAMIVGCATTVVTTDDRPPDIELDTLVLRNTPHGVESLDAREMFKAGTDAYARGDHERAASLFQDVARLFPESKYAAHALYDAGLALIQLERWKDAAASLSAAQVQLESPRDKADALCQMSVCYERIEAWREARATLQSVLAFAGLSVRERVEARARLGIAFYGLGDFARAERALEAALTEARQNPGVPSLRNNPVVARAQFIVGEIYRELFRSIHFRLPVEAMQRDLADKSSFFLKAQSAYLSAIRLSAKPWSVAGGFRLGELYESMYTDMMGAEVPDELTAEDRDIYFGELKRHVRPLVERAVDIYERNLAMSDRIGGSAEWSRQSEVGLERMRAIMNTEFNTAAGN